MNVLHLTLKKKWFDMIASGEKTEEYREIKIYWLNRFLKYPTMDISCIKSSEKTNFDVIVFRNGYSQSAPRITVECLGIEIGPAKPEWSDNWKGDVFIIKLGKKIS